MVIILFPYRFNDYYYKKYQISEFKKKFRREIEVHDISEIISKNWYKGYKTKRHKSAKVFNSINKWKTYLNKKKKVNNKIFVINTISSNSFISFYVHYILFKSKVILIKLNSPEVYAPAKSKTLILRIVVFFQILFFNFSRFLFLFKNFFFSNLLYFLKFEKMYVLFCGSKKYLLPLNINSKKIFFKRYNSSDYANSIILKKKRRFKKKNYIVFLDIKAPAFPGDDASFNNPIVYNVKKWYEDLNNFLDKVQKIFKAEIIIIPHPSVRKLKNIYYNKKFKVARTEDASSSLISNCKFVIANGATTAVSYCVIYDKPVTFMYSNQVIKSNPTMMFETISLSKILSAKSININNRISKKNFSLKVNKKKYLRYKYNYLTSKKTKDIQNSEILKSLVS